MTISDEVQKSYLKKFLCFVVILLKSLFLLIMFAEIDIFLLFSTEPLISLFNHVTLVWYIYTITITYFHLFFLSAVAQRAWIWYDQYRKIITTKCLKIHPLLVFTIFFFFLISGWICPRRIERDGLFSQPLLLDSQTNQGKFMLVFHLRGINSWTQNF